MASTCIRTCSSSAPGAGLLDPVGAEPTGTDSSGVTRRVAPFAELLIDSEEDLVLRAVLARGCYVSPTADSARWFGAGRATADHRPWPRATTIGPSANAYGPTAYRLQRRLSVPFGGRTESPERGPSPEEVAQMNTHYPLFRIAFAAAAAVFIFLMVHAALEGVSRSADVLAALQ